MKKKLTYLLLLCTLLFSVPACSQMSELPDTEETNPVVAEEQTTNTEPASTTTENTDATDTSGQTDESLPQDNRNTASIDLSAVPEYSGSPAVEINGNVPFFSEEDKSRTDAFEEYSELDSLGRCGVAYANICTELMPTEERGEIGSVKPSGWHTANYNGYVEGNYLYNRCHLIGFQLAGENANPKNLITGTRYMNCDGQLPYENEVADYVKRTGNHVLYRVTPIFDGNNLVASGVLEEAYSVEDQGSGIQFCVYCYNVQPGITIDYATGDSHLTEGYTGEYATSSYYSTGTVKNYSGNATETGNAEDNTNDESSVESAAPEQAAEGSADQNTDAPAGDYIINTNTGKFHVPTCSSVSRMNDSNKKEVQESRDQLIAEGYSPCKNCNP